MDLFVCSFRTRILLFSTIQFTGNLFHNGHSKRQMSNYIYFKKFQMEAITSSLRDFDVLNKLGEGAFGQVFRVKRKKDGKQYALKKVKIGSMKQKERDNALNEIRILASYDGEFIIGYKEAFYDENSGALCVVMEFASQGDILKRNQNHIKARTKYKQQQIWKALVHMIKGLKSLHDKKILHRDLKCANVFITADGTYKLGDLNVSKVLKKDLACTQTGTPYYASPQVWKDKPYGVKSDIWSLGCVLYQMCALKPPFTATDLQGLYRKVCAGVFQRIPMCFSNQLSTVISSLLKIDPQKRPNTDEILSNPVVHRKYVGQINTEPVQECDELLQTLKYNPKDLKGLKKILPKSNYEDEVKQVKKLDLDEFRNGISSCKNNRKEPFMIKQEMKKSIENNDRKLEQFLERKRKLQEDERLRKMKIMNEQKDQLIKRRQRVLSACGIRQPENYNLHESPRIAVHKKSDDSSSQAPGSVRAIKKDQSKNVNINMKMPPKPQVNPNGNNINYRLPPRPVYGGGQGSQESNRSYDQQSSRQRQKSKQNLRNIGAQIVQGRQKQMRPPSSNNRIVRSNSQQRVVYPSWWG